jgi:hypothetical protein
MPQMPLSGSRHDPLRRKELPLPSLCTAFAAHRKVCRYGGRCFGTKGFGEFHRGNTARDTLPVVRIGVYKPHALNDGGSEGPV